MKEVIEEKTYTKKSLMKLIEEFLKDADEINIIAKFYMNELDTCEQLIEIEKQSNEFYVRIHDTFC